MHLLLRDKAIKLLIKGTAKKADQNKMQIILKAHKNIFNGEVVWKLLVFI